MPNKEGPTKAGSKSMSNSVESHIYFPVEFVAFRWVLLMQIGNLGSVLALHFSYTAHSKMDGC